VRIHQDAVADKYLRTHRADAVTLGTNIYFHSEKPVWANPSGLGLLAHEITHAAQQQSQDWRAPNLGHHFESHENVALENERWVRYQAQSQPLLHEFVGQQGTPMNTGFERKRQERYQAQPQSLVSLPQAPVVRNTMPASPILAASSKPRFAREDRIVGNAPPRGYAEPCECRLSGSERLQLKEEILAYIKMRMKEEFERGA
jgi:hypothetical protein